MSNQFDRRELIKITAGAVLAAQVASAGGAHQFFSPEEYAVVDDLSEMVIPADDHSPGAKAAKVAHYIDRVLFEYAEKEEQDDFRSGLKPYLKATADERDALLKKASAEEKEAKTPEGKFFRLLKEHTIKGYYTSGIGIHNDLDYKGNVVQPGQYAGYLPS